MDEHVPVRVGHEITVTATMILSEHELCALDALAGYGDDAFLKAFYAEMGESYLKPHEQGLRSLFDNVRKVCGPARNQVERARLLLREKPDG